MYTFQNKSHEFVKYTCNVSKAVHFVFVPNVAKQEAQLLLRDSATRKPVKDRWNSVDVLYSSEILDVEMTTYIVDWDDLQMSFKVINSGTNRKLVYDFLLVVQRM